MPPEDKVTGCSSKFLAVTAGFLKVKHLLPQRDVSWKYCQPPAIQCNLFNKFGLFTSIVKEKSFLLSGLAVRYRNTVVFEWKGIIVVSFRKAFLPYTCLQW